MHVLSGVYIHVTFENGVYVRLSILPPPPTRALPFIVVLPSCHSVLLFHKRIETCFVLV